MPFNRPHIWSCFMPDQKRNLLIYIFGIMCYKFGIEYFNGSFLALANERFGESRYERIGLLTGLNYAAQGVGSIAIAPLVKRVPIRIVLMGAILAFSVISAMIMVIDAATGGQMKFKTPDKQTLYGAWNPNLLFLISVFSGLSYGMVELIRRVIPRDIVGGDPVRLKKMDGMVHVCYELAGTAGALTSERLIDHFGFTYSAFLSPPLFFLAAITWWFLDVYKPNKDDMLNTEVDFEGKRASHTAAVELLPIDRSHASLMQSVKHGLHSFFKATYFGAWLCLRNRKFIWLIPSYTFALYGHRYLEYGVVQIFAKSVLGNSGLAQVIVGGSNLGELLGAASVMIFTQAVPTPIPWLRLDALFLNLVWVLPFFPYVFGSASSARSTAWKLAPVMIPISYGWAGGDCSLSAHIQSSLSKLEQEDDDVSALGAVMAFLYVSYICLYSVTSTLLGRWVDNRLRDKFGEAMVMEARNALKMVGGVHFTVLGLIILLGTFVPRGAFAVNPKVIDQQRWALYDDTEAPFEPQEEIMQRAATADNGARRTLRTADNLSSLSDSSATFVQEPMMPARSKKPIHEDVQVVSRPYRLQPAHPADR